MPQPNGNWHCYVRTPILPARPAEELERFRRLNVAYRDKFGFPFIMAVRDADRTEILDAFERRLANDAAIEFETALAEVHKIARLRLAAIEAGP